MVIIIGVEIVDPHHLLAARQQRHADVVADEAGRTGEEDSHLQLPCWWCERLSYHGLRAIGIDMQPRFRK
jgi:hypothetical protein